MTGVDGGIERGTNFLTENLGRLLKLRPIFLVVPSY